MGEKVLIQSQRYNTKKFLIIWMVSVLVLFVIESTNLFVDCMDDYNAYKETYTEHLGDDACGGYDIPLYDQTAHPQKCWSCRTVMNESKMEYSMDAFFGSFENLHNPGESLFYPVVIWGFFAIVGFLIWFWLRSFEMTVTDKRVYGKIKFGIRVDLPVDSISSISTLRIFKGVAVATSSGKIAFCFIKNADRIYPILNDLIVKRQQKKATTVSTAPTAPEAPSTDTADQLLKFKTLLDSGVITQEEFDAKKKQLLNL